jgi:superfamily I DNA and/or RNA helicase
LPEIGRVELASLRRSLSVVNLQLPSIKALESDDVLHHQLLAPHVVIRNATTEDSGLSAATVGLDKDVRDIVQRIAETEPFVALQGPPGTGKTTVVNAVIDTLLRDDPTLRVLISAQSHAAVDNLALRLKGRLAKHESRPISLRVAAEEAYESSRVRPNVAEDRSSELAKRLAREIRVKFEAALHETSKGVLPRAYAALKTAMTDNILELQERIEEGANVVFATTAGTNRVRAGSFMRYGRFDLAVVDEASKAWPTEILQPLILANRYLLVGDHKQLPAFGEILIERALQACFSSQSDDFRFLATHQAAVRDWLSLFGSFFGSDQKVIRADERLSTRWRSSEKPIEQLKWQFRMRPEIAAVVSRAFYGGDGLKTHPSVTENSLPSWLHGTVIEKHPFRKRLVWIDTGSLDRFRNLGELRNEGEAELAAKIVAYFSRYSQDHEPDGHDAVVALSPYRDQNRLLGSNLLRRGLDDKRLVQTVDSFQGQEADVAVISLVRTLAAETGGRPPTLAQRYGFLVSPQRANVMLSRARELEIIIGDYDLFFGQLNLAEGRQSFQGCWPDRQIQVFGQMYAKQLQMKAYA